VSDGDRFKKNYQISGKRYSDYTIEVPITTLYLEGEEREIKLTVLKIV
jgi:hypothetical protein